MSFLKGLLSRRPKALAEEQETPLPLADLVDASFKSVESA
jgi:hypothetical protein